MQQLALYQAWAVFPGTVTPLRRVQALYSHLSCSENNVRLGGQPSKWQTAGAADGAGPGEGEGAAGTGRCEEGTAYHHGDLKAEQPQSYNNKS